MENQNTFIPHGCQGTCKTMLGCTCDRNIQQNAEPVEVGVEVVAAQKSSGCGCSKKKDGGSCCKSGGSCCRGKNKLEVYDWLQDMPDIMGESQMVEVQFKNTRKGYFLNSNNIELYKGDIVAVEATPGHDIGEVTLTGKLVQLQMLKNNYRGETKRIYRIAKQSDIDKKDEARAKEHKTMLRAREIAEELKLGMKISDVEYQGDGNKAIFYYIADERVDFRQLIKVYASEFRVKIEMKQIGARQEAGRVGGIGPCGRELCCSSSMSNFISVSTSAARLQDIPLNPQKLAGQCGKLKCCLNFEVDTYVEAQRTLPHRDVVLETKDSSYFHFKTDILSGVMTYSTDKHFAANLVAIPKDRVYEVIRMNKQGGRPANLLTDSQDQAEKQTATSHDILQENINRFDNNGGNNRNKKKKHQKSRPEGNNPNGNNQNAQSNQNRNENRPNNQKQGNNKQLTLKTDAAVSPSPTGDANTEQANQKERQNKNGSGNFKHNRHNRNRQNKNGNTDQKKPEA